MIALAFGAESHSRGLFHASALPPVRWRYHVRVVPRISGVGLAALEPSLSGKVLARFRGGNGRFVDAPMDRHPVDEVVAGLPVREFRRYRGRRHYSGWCWAVTTGGHVVYESRLELARILLADNDPEVAGIAYACRRKRP
jgi:hypothetical protein